MADEVLSNAVQGISDLITVQGLINLDFADVRAIMSGMGKALMGTGFGSGKTKAEDAVHRAIASPLLDEMSVNGARGILINITGGPDLTLLETDKAIALVHEAADENANIIFGTVICEEYQNQVKATVIATGFEGAVIRQEPVPIVMTDRSNRKKRTFEKEAESEPVEIGINADPGCEDMDISDMPARPEPDDTQLEDTDVNKVILSEAEATSGEEVDIEPESEPDVPRPPGIKKELSLPKSYRKVEAPSRPELELNASSKIVKYPDKLPEYNRLGLASVQGKKPDILNKNAIEIDTSNYMIPAFLRRKAE